MYNAPYQSGRRGAELLRKMYGHTDTIKTMAYLPDGQRLVTGSADKTVRIWNVANGRQEGSSMVHLSSVLGLAVTSDGRRIVSSDNGGRIMIWDVESQTLVREWQLADTHTGVQVAVSPNDRLVAYGYKTIVIRELDSGRIKHEMDIIVWGVWSLCFSPNGFKLACGKMTNIHIYDVENGTLILEVKGHRDWVRALLWSHDGSKLYSASQDKTICSWNAGTGERIGEPWRGHTEWIRTLSLSSDGTKIVSGSRDKTVRFWDSTSGRPIGYLLQHGKQVWAVSFSPSDDFVASAGESAKVSFWRVPNDTNDTMSMQLSPPPAQSRALQNVRVKSKNNSDLHRASQGYRPPTNSAFKHEPRNTQPQVIRSSPKQADTSRPASDHDKPVNIIRDVHPDQPQEQFANNNVQSHSIIGTPTSQMGQSPASGPHHSSTIPFAIYVDPRPPAKSGHPTASFSRKDKSLLQSFPPPPDLTPHIVKLDDLYREVGGFSDVYKCGYTSPSGVKEVAVKAFRFVFKIDEGSNKYAKMVRRELGIWRRLSHTNIVPFLGIANGFGMDGSTSLVSLWMTNGSLHKFISTHDKELSIGHRLRILSDVAKGLDYLHSFPDTPIVHGDLSGNNVLLDANFTARLTDFGYSSFMGNIPEGLTYLEKSTARPGALRWIAPEQIEDSYERTPKSDIYSFGCVALQVFSGKKPWSEIREEAGIAVRLSKGQNPSWTDSRPIDDQYWNFIQRCWSSIEDRPSSANVVSSIEQFLGSCPPFQSLREVFRSSGQMEPIRPSRDAPLPPSMILPFSDVMDEPRHPRLSLSTGHYRRSTESTDTAGRIDFPNGGGKFKLRVGSLLGWKRKK